MKRLVVALVLLVGCVGEIENDWPPSYAPPGPDAGGPAFCAAYKFTPSDFYPTEYPVNIILDGKLSYHYIDIMLTAIRTWNDRMRMEVLFPTITSNPELHNNCNYAMVSDTTDLPSMWIGLTTYGKCAADIVNVETMDTMMNHRGKEYYTDDLVLNVTVHELGHVLGLEHEADPNSVMFASVGPGAVRYISTESYCLVQQSVIHTQ